MLILRVAALATAIRAATAPGPSLGGQEGSRRLRAARTGVMRPIGNVRSSGQRYVPPRAGDDVRAHGAAPASGSSATNSAAATAAPARRTRQNRPQNRPQAPLRATRRPESVDAAPQHAPTRAAAPRHLAQAVIFYAPSPAPVLLAGSYAPLYEDRAE